MTTVLNLQRWFVVSLRPNG